MAGVATMLAKEHRLQDPAAAAPALVLQAMQPTNRGMQHIEQHPDWGLLAQLPMRLTAGVALPGFKVRHLLALKAGQTIASRWTSTDDVPLRIGAVLLSWSEFEVVEQRMAVRLTRLG